MKRSGVKSLIAGLAVTIALAGPALSRTAAATPPKPLDIYFIDVEGGQATLFVPPSGQSLLIDTGWPGNAGRDADRIATTAKKAGLTKIDFVLLTHYHVDHAGGVPQLVAKIPVGAFIDHGPNREPGDKDTEVSWQAYQKLLTGQHAKRIVAKVGDVLPIDSSQKEGQGQGLRAEVVSSDGEVLHAALPGAGSANPACAASEKPAVDQTENARSLGTIFTFGKIRILDLGDLTKDKEAELVCPNNKLGPVDIFIVSHHGWSQSNSKALLAAISPRVAIMDNGAAKGGSPSSWDTIRNTPSLEDLWQLHFSNEGAAEHNSAASFIANPAGADAGNYLKLTVWADGHFDVYNSRTEAIKHYPSTW